MIGSPRVQPFPDPGLFYIYPGRVFDLDTLAILCLNLDRLDLLPLSKTQSHTPPDNSLVLSVLEMLLYILRSLLLGESHL